MKTSQSIAGILFAFCAAFALVATAPRAAAQPLLITTSTTSGTALTFTSIDTPSPGDDITVSAGVVITTTNGAITFNAGDSINTGVGSFIWTRNAAVTLVAGYNDTAKDPENNNMLLQGYILSGTAGGVSLSRIGTVGTITNTGTIEVGNSALTLNTTLVNNGLVIFNGTTTTGTFSGVITGTGVVSMPNVIGILTNSGTIANTTIIDNLGEIVNNGYIASATVGWGFLYNNSPTAIIDGPVTLVGFQSSNGLSSWFTNNSGVVNGTLTIGANAYATFTSGTLLGPIVNSGTIRFANTAGYTQASVISGTGILVKDAAGTLVLSATETYTGNTWIKAGVLVAGVANAITSSPSVLIESSGTLSLGGFNQTLKSLTLRNLATVSFDSQGANYTKFSLNSLSGNGGIFVMRADMSGTPVGDQLLLTGSSSGAHFVRVVFSGVTQDDTKALDLIKTTQPGATFSLGATGTMSVGMLTYHIQQGDGGLLMPEKLDWYLTPFDQVSNSGKAILYTAGIQGTEWHYSLDSMLKRMGDVRSALAENPDAGHANSLWVRTSAYRLNANAAFAGTPLSETVYDFSVGTDKVLQAGDNYVLVGAVMSAGRTHRDFTSGPRVITGSGSTGDMGVGVYASWLNKNGFYADVVLKYDKYTNDFTVQALDGFGTNAKYANSAKGASAEFGYLMTRDGDPWWVDLSGQAALAVIAGAHYTAPSASPINVSIDSSRATQYRVQMRVGRNGLGKWKPYVRMAEVRAEASKNSYVSANGVSYRPFFNGWRYEVGVGTSYNITKVSQFYADYEYSKADNYTRPWAVNLGYRYTW